MTWVLAPFGPDWFGLRRRAAGFAALLTLLGLGAQLSSAVEPPETIDPAASCVAGGCHSFVGEYPHLHWSKFAEENQCQKCHKSDGNLHEFENEEPPELCLDCHDALAKKMRSAKVVHEAAEDDCTDCHDPHGGEVKAMLEDVVDEDLKELCFTCHDEDIAEREYVHGPVSQGACNLCHDPHASSHRKLLYAGGAELCGKCHEEITDQIRGSKFVHEPAEDDCIDCHDPHSSEHPKMLTESKRALCKECHDEIVKAAEQSKVGHDPALTGDECLNCHSPHASNHPANLKSSQRELCLGCHDQRVDSGDTRLKDMKQWLADNEVWHEPIRKGDCVGCHSPHGSSNFRLLKKSYPPQFYSPFKIANYGLCFSCHKHDLATARRTRTATGFRDGERNLHFLHVNKAKRGRTCRACHDVHASSHPLQLLDNVPFGKWLMPINFEKTDTGGSCLPGCHSLKVYERTASNPVPEH